MTPAQLALQRFATKWSHHDNPPVKVDSGDLAITEHHLGRRLPRAYHEAVTMIGLPRPTLSLLTSIVDAEADFGDVNAFFTAAEIVEDLDSFRTDATPDAFVAFASDCMGDRYGFLCPPGDAARPADAPVLRMDHETGEVSEVAASFVDWLLDYDALDFVHFEDVEA